MQTIKNYLIKNDVTAELFQQWKQSTRSSNPTEIIYLIGALLIIFWAKNCQGMQIDHLSWLAITYNFRYFDKFNLYFQTCQSIYQQLQKTITFYFRNFGEAITVASLSILLIKFILFLGFNYQLNVYQYIILCGNILIVDYKFNLYYYLRLGCTILISKTCGEKMLEDQVCMIECNEEQDLIDQPNDLADRYLTGSYIPNPNKQYVIEIPKETYINIITRNVLIGLVWLRLWLLAEPILFGLLRCCLVYNLIANNLIIITYIISMLLLISRILFYLVDRNNQQVQQTYQDLYRFTCVDNLQEELITETMAPSYRNAVIYMYCTIRDIHYTSNVHYLSCRFEIIYQTLYYRLCNLNFVENLGPFTIKYITFNQPHKYTNLFLFQLFSCYILFEMLLTNNFQVSCLASAVVSTINKASASQVNSLYSQFQYLGKMSPNDTISKTYPIKCKDTRNEMYHKQEIYKKNKLILVQDLETTLNPEKSHAQNDIQPMYTWNENDNNFNHLGINLQKTPIEILPCTAEYQQEFLKQCAKYGKRNSGILFDYTNKPHELELLINQIKNTNQNHIPPIFQPKKRIISYDIKEYLEQHKIYYFANSTGCGLLPQIVLDTCQAVITASIDGPISEKIAIEKQLIIILPYLIQDPDLPEATRKTYNSSLIQLRARQNNFHKIISNLNANTGKFTYDVPAEHITSTLLDNNEKIIIALETKPLSQVLLQYPGLNFNRNPKFTNCYNKAEIKGFNPFWNKFRKNNYDQVKINQNNKQNLQSKATTQVSNSLTTTPNTNSTCPLDVN